MDMRGPSATVLLVPTVKDEKDGAWGDNITITTGGTYATSAGVPPTACRRAQWAVSS